MADQTLDKSSSTASARVAAGASAWQAALRTPLVMGLAGLLAVQLLVAAVSGGNRLAPAASESPLAGFDAQRIDQLEISTGDGAAALVLNRAEAGWTIAALGDFPADSSRVDQLLETIAELHRPLPIATSAAARQRFKVADDNFEQRIVLQDGSDTLATLFLGDSPGFRRRYLRPAGDEGVYDVRFEVFNLSAQPNDWIARDQLRLERDRIQRLAGEGWSLTKKDDSWTLADTSSESEGTLDQTKVEALLTTLANLGYREVLGTEAPEGFDPDAAMFRLEISLGEDGEQEYLIAPLRSADQSDESTDEQADDQAEDPTGLGQDYVLKAASSPYYFLLADFDLGPLIGLDASKLVKAPAHVQNE
ncbi:hypothetical protein Thiowin_04608 [Thiorhodovibrio winogradskyi]|uniref:DUF4340 domain-containing protein n=1 Tax=Thiorhodovibrio winogradskyi TaxID=77007 RepID=A0ABZ0SG54_9GAMM|nr:DUF4340 domain-containing protein [Thiorhodovibrio winogradskyi]